jgi:isopenicillin-N epimerase
MFLLDPTIIFLNHGSFGATPEAVFAAYQKWQRELERQPVQFLGSDLTHHLAQARQALGAYLNVAADDLVYVPNATYGVNVVAHSLGLGPGDEVLTTSHEYGACARTWQFWAQQRGFRLRVVDFGWPLPPPEELIAKLLDAITPQTKLLFISHITSPTAVLFPIPEICAQARARGVLTLVDGAHAPGQIGLDLTAVGADFYTGNCHKWLCAPKGSAFLYTHPDQQAKIQPLIVSWGWGDDRPFSFGSDYLDYLQWTGTNDPAAYLAVPAAIAFQAEQQWDKVRADCSTLLQDGLAQLAEVTGLPSPYADERAVYLPPQLGVIPLPWRLVGNDPQQIPALKQTLYQQYRIEIPLIHWQTHFFTRLSVQAYTTPADVHALVVALRELLGKG